MKSHRQAPARLDTFLSARSVTGSVKQYSFVICAWRWKQTASWCPEIRTRRLPRPISWAKLATKDFKAFYRKWIGPDVETILIVGDTWAGAMRSSS